MMTEMTKDPLTEPAGGANPASAGGEDDLGAYFRELRQYPRLSPQEERELAVACAAGDPAALRRMVQCNLRLVVSVAREYAGRGVPLMDLIQEGNIGLIVAARKFDYTRELRFSTYATKWIRQGITRCLMNHAGLIRVPIHTAERMRAILAARSAYVQAHGQEPDLDRLAEAAARQLGLHFVCYWPDYERYGRQAPLRRNDRIIEAADLVLAFWDFHSRGTSYVIAECIRRGKPVRVFDVDPTRGDRSVF